MAEGVADDPPSIAAEPLYAQVARKLRAEIVGGAYPVGRQLPAEDALSARFSVSRHTVREALRRLRDQGLITSRRGAGTVVAAPRGVDPHVLQVMSIGDLVAFAHGTRLRIDEIRVGTLSPKLAVRAGLPAGDEWLVVRGARCRGEDGPPTCLIEYLINRRFAGVGRLLPRHDGPVFQLIEDLFAVRIAEVEQEIGAVALSADVAAELGVAARSVALEVRRAYRLDDGTVAQVTINIHPAARFRHSMTMRRPPA